MIKEEIELHEGRAKGQSCCGFWRSLPERISRTVEHFFYRYVLVSKFNELTSAEQLNSGAIRFCLCAGLECILPKNRTSGCWGVS